MAHAQFNLKYVPNSSERLQKGDQARSYLASKLALCLKRRCGGWLLNRYPYDRMGIWKPGSAEPRLPLAFVLVFGLAEDVPFMDHGLRDQSIILFPMAKI